MGNVDTKLNFRKAVVQLTSKTQVHICFINKFICKLCNKVFLMLFKRLSNYLEVTVCCLITRILYNYLLIDLY